MKEDTIIYFGTTRQGSGHGATVIRGGFDDYLEQASVERQLDNLENNKACMDLYKRSNDRFNTIRFTDGTIFFCLLSPDDERGGSKTMVYVRNQQLSEAEMIDLIRSDRFLKDRFSKVCNKYNIENIFETKQ